MQWVHCLSHSSTNTFKVGAFTFYQEDMVSFSAEVAESADLSSAVWKEEKCVSITIRKSLCHQRTEWNTCFTGAQLPLKASKPFKRVSCLLSAPLVSDCFLILRIQLNVFYVFHFCFMQPGRLSSWITVFVCTIREQGCRATRRKVNPGIIIRECMKHFILPDW